MRPRERERGRLQRCVISEVLWIFANIFAASQSRFLSRGPQLSCWEATGGYYWDPVYYFGRGFLLTVWSWGRSAQRGHWLATAPLRSHMATERERGGRAKRRRNGAELFRSSPSRFHPRARSSSPVSSVQRGLLLFSFRLHPEQTSTSTSSISLHTGPTPPERPPPPHPRPRPTLAALSSDRHSYPPGRFLSAGLPQQRCSVM